MDISVMLHLLNVPDIAIIHFTGELQGTVTGSILQFTLWDNVLPDSFVVFL
jgi:hypothetical protein